MEIRIDEEAEAGERGTLWTATSLLMGLRYKTPVINRLLKGVREMKESVVYQAIQKEGKDIGHIEEAVSTLLRLGTRRLGKPSQQVKARITALMSLETLRELTDRVYDVETWDELLV